MRSKFDAPLVGLILGVIVPLFGVFIFYKFNFKTLDFGEFIDYVSRKGMFPQLLSLSVIANLGLFFTFIWKKFYYSAKGVIMATFLYVLVVIILKYFV